MMVFEVKELRESPERKGPPGEPDPALRRRLIGFGVDQSPSVKDCFFVTSFDRDEGHEVSLKIDSAEAADTRIAMLMFARAQAFGVKPSDGTEGKWMNALADRFMEIQNHAVETHKARLASSSPKE